MIKTPVKRCIVSDNIVDSQGNWLAKLHDLGADSDEIVKRINLHEELEEAFSFCLDFFIDRASSKEDIEKIHKFSELLEKCHE